MTIALPRLPPATISIIAPGESAGAAKGAQQATVAADGALIPVIYGRQRVGAKIFAVAMSGSELWLGCLWGIGPIEAIESIEVNDLAYSFGVDYRTDYLGSPTQTVNPDLATLISGYADTLVASVGGTQVPLAYSVLGFLAVGSGFPRVTAIIKGRKVYDPRDSSTAYSRNPALCLADWITHPVYGQGLDVDWASVEAVADECDDTLSDASARRELDLIIDSDLPVAQWADILRTYAGCFIVHDGSNVKLVPDRPATATRAIGASDIMERSLTLRRLPMSTRPTVVEVGYTDATVSPWRDARVQAKASGVDAGTLPRRLDSISLPGITRRAQAYREAAERLNAATLTDLEASWITADAGLQDLVGDVVTVTHPIGLTAVDFRLLGVDLLEPGRWQVTARNYDADVYSDSITPPDGGDYTALPDPADIPTVSGLTAASGNDYLLLGTDGSVVSRMAISWTAITWSYVGLVEVQCKRATDSVWQEAGKVSGATSVIASPVEDGVTYDIRARIHNSLGQLGDWAVTQHVVIGKTELPPNLDSFSVAALADGTRSLTWSMTEPADLAGYEVRYTAGSSGTWASMTPLHTGLLRASPFETNLLAAGTYTFAAKAVDTSGNYSATDKQIVTTLPDPRLSGVLDYVDPYQLGWPGTKTYCWVGEDGKLYATDVNDWADLSGSTWSTWTAGWAQDARDMVYTHDAIDVGVITTFTPLVSVVCPVGTPTIEERYHDTDISSGTWAAAGSAPITCRYYQARVTVASTAGQQARLEGMAIILNADPLEEEIEDVATSTLTGSYRIGTGDIRLPLVKDFAVIRTVFVTLQSVGAGWSWELIDKTPTYGPRIKIYNASNVAADATIDAIIRGL